MTRFFMAIRFGFSLVLLALVTLSTPIYAQMLGSEAAYIESQAQEDQSDSCKEEREAYESCINPESSDPPPPAPDYCEIFELDKLACEVKQACQLYPELLNYKLPQFEKLCQDSKRQVPEADSQIPPVLTMDFECSIFAMKSVLEKCNGSSAYAYAHETAARDERCSHEAGVHYWTCYEDICLKNILDEPISCEALCEAKSAAKKRQCTTGLGNECDSAFKACWDKQVKPNGDAAPDYEKLLLCVPEYVRCMEEYRPTIS